MWWLYYQTFKANRFDGVIEEVFLIKKAEGSIGKLRELSIDTFFLEEVIDYIKHAKRQIDQIIRRVVNGELIPHNEKVFSIFEAHTEWISKGKAGVPVELGLRVAIIEDQYKFILEHEVMEKITDEQIAVTLIKRAKENYPDIKWIRPAGYAFTTLVGLGMLSNGIH